MLSQNLWMFQANIPLSGCSIPAEVFFVHVKAYIEPAIEMDALLFSFLKMPLLKKILFLFSMFIGEAVLVKLSIVYGSINRMSLLT